MIGKGVFVTAWGVRDLVEDDDDVNEGNPLSAATAAAADCLLLAKAGSGFCGLLLCFFPLLLLVKIRLPSPSVPAALPPPAGSS